MNKQVDADLEKALYPELRKLTGLLDADAKKMRDVCNFVYWANKSRIELKFDVTERQLELCEMVLDTKNLAEFNSHLELMQLPTYEIVQVLRDLTKVQEGKMELASSSIFMKYYAKLGKTLEVTPKFIFYSGHS